MRIARIGLSGGRGAPAWIIYLVIGLLASIGYGLLLTVPAKDIGFCVVGLSAAVAGCRVADKMGDHFNVRALPEPLRDGLIEKRPIEVDRPKASELREDLGLKSGSRL